MRVRAGGNRRVIGAGERDDHGLVDRATSAVAGTDGVTLGDGVTFTQGLRGSQIIVKGVGPDAGAADDGHGPVGGARRALQTPGFCGSRVAVADAERAAGCGGTGDDAAVILVARFGDAAGKGARCVGDDRRVVDTRDVDDDAARGRGTFAVGDRDGEAVTRGPALQGVDFGGIYRVAVTAVSVDRQRAVTAGSTPAPGEGLRCVDVARNQRPSDGRVAVGRGRVDHAVRVRAGGNRRVIGAGERDQQFTQVGGSRRIDNAIGECFSDALAGSQGINGGIPIADDISVAAVRPQRQRTVVAHDSRTVCACRTSADGGKAACRTFRTDSNAVDSKCFSIGSRICI